jgi:flagellin
MALTVATNSGALMAQAAASSVNKSMEGSMERLATGKRINSAADDAAGVAIASRLTSEIRGTNQAIRNAMDGQAMIDTAEGAHKEVENILQRMRELAVQASNDTNNATDRTNLQAEMSQLTTEIDRIAQTTAWAGANLLDGKATGKATAHADTADFTLQVGSGTTSSDTIVANIGAVTAGALGVGGATSRASVTSVTSTAGGATTASAMDANGKITITGTVANGNTISLNVNGTAHTLTVSNADKYEVSVKGVAQQLADEITALGLPAVKVTADDTGVTFSAGAAIGRPVVTSTITTSAASGTLTETNANAIMTFAGDFNHGDEYALSFNGITKTITASNADQYEDNAKGLAAQMAAAFDTDMHTADTAREAGTISSTQLKLTGTSVTDNGDGTITFAQDTNPQLTASVNHSDNAQTIAVSGSVITITSVGASVVSDRYDITINGEAISYTATANDGFDHTKVAGGAAGLAQAINANTDLNLAGYSATSSAGAVTIARTAKDIVDISTTATGGKATLTEAAGVFTVGGNIDNTDKFSMVIDGVTVEATISTSDGFSDTTTGAAQQIAQAINDANVPGVKAKFNNNATFTLERSGSLSLSNTANSQLSVEFIDAAIQTVNSQRAALGSISNRLDSTVSNLTNISANLTAGRGRIEDADFAAETTNLAKSQILQQASTAMLAQANASKQGVLSLLQG